MNNDFEDYLMYKPPYSSQEVPIAHFIWNANGNANSPSTGIWADYAKENGGSDSAGTVTDSDKDATFLESNEFPMWTQIDNANFVLQPPFFPNQRNRMPEPRPQAVKQEKSMKKPAIVMASGLLLGAAATAMEQAPPPQTVTHGFTRRFEPLTPEASANIDRMGDLDHAAAKALDAGQFAEAEADARESLSIGFGAGVSQEILASALDAQGKDQEAFEVYQTIANQGCRHSRTLLPYARLLLKSGQWAQAVNAYNKQLPYLAWGDMMEAKSRFSPDVPQPRELATAIHIALGLTQICHSGWGGRVRNKEAMIEFAEALHLSPDSDLANYYYGYGWRRLSLTERKTLADPALAKAALKKAAASEDGDVKEAAEKALVGL